MKTFADFTDFYKSTKILSLNFCPTYIAIQYCTSVVYENVIQQAAKFTNQQKFYHENNLAIYGSYS